MIHLYFYHVDSLVDSLVEISNHINNHRSQPNEQWWTLIVYKYLLCKSNFNKYKNGLIYIFLFTLRMLFALWAFFKVLPMNFSNIYLYFSNNFFFEQVLLHFSYISTLSTFFSCCTGGFHVCSLILIPIISFTFSIIAFHFECNRRPNDLWKKEWLKAWHGIEWLGVVL